MELTLANIKDDPYQNFIDYLNNDQTRAMYLRILKKFLKSLPKEIFEKNLQKSGDTVPELTTLFVELANKDIGLVKQIIHAYVRELKKKQESNNTKSSTLKNQLKPIVTLFDANEIDFSWKLINKSIPKAGVTQDRAYTTEELQIMMLDACDILDKIIILLFSCAGFRLGAWDYITWNDIIFFYTENNEPKGMGIRVYAGDAEEYWTHGTPEAQKIILLYREEWKVRFGTYPDISDPLIVSAKIRAMTRLSSAGVSGRVRNLLKRTGLQGINVQADNGFRKFFNTMCRRAKVNAEDREDMMGHFLGLQKHYERYEEQDFERFPEYQKAIPFLTISDEERSNHKALVAEQEISQLQIEKEKNVEAIEITKTQGVLIEDLQRQLVTLAEKEINRTKIKPTEDKVKRVMKFMEENNLL